MKLKIEKIAHYGGHQGSIFSLEEAREPHLFYSGSHDQLVVEWNLDEPSKNNAVSKLPSKAYAIRYIKEADLLLIGNFHGGVHVIDLKAGKEIKLLQVHRSTIFDIQYDYSRRQFVVCASDGTFSMWDIDTFNIIEGKQITEKKLRCAAYHPSEDILAFGAGDGCIYLMDLNSYEIVQKIDGHTTDYSVNTIQFHPNGKYLISGSRDAHINLYSIENNYELVHRIPAHNYGIYSIVFHPEGHLFASCSMDKTIKIWDAKTMKLLSVINKEKYDGHINSVNKLIWVKHNNTLLSTGDDRSIQAWKITTA